MASKTNKIKYGIKNCYYAKATFAEDGTATYATPVSLPGARSLSLSAEGENENWYADNIAYVVLNNNNGYSGDLELALIPDDFRTDILGETLTTEGILVENQSAEVEHFALLFQFEGDVKATRHVLYNCTCSRPGMEGETREENLDPKTETLSITATALENGNVKAKTTATTSDTIYNSWFKSVWQPDDNEE